MNFMEYVQAENKKKGAIQIDMQTTAVMHPTSYMYFDYKNGMYCTRYDNDDNAVGIYHNVGWMNGSVNTIIGKSNVGKTTFAFQSGFRAIRAFMEKYAITGYLCKESIKNTNTLITIADSEKTFDMNNAKRLTDMPAGALKATVSIHPITTDKDLMEVVTKHTEWKEKNLSKIKMPIKDIFNDDIYVYPPTVLIVDSLTNVMIADSSEVTEYEKATNNTAGARRAKMIGQMLGILTAVAKKYNVIVFNIAHINISPSMSFIPKAKQYRGLAQDETLSGGEKQLYLASNMIRLYHVKDIGTEKSSMLNMGEGVTGLLVRGKIIKTKTNSFGGEFFLIGTKEKGFDALSSTIYQAMESGHIEKKGNSYILEKHPDIKFNLRNHKEVFYNNPKMLGSLNDQLLPYLEKYLSSSEQAHISDKKLETIDMYSDDIPDELAEFPSFE